MGRSEEGWVARLANLTRLCLILWKMALTGMLAISPVKGLLPVSFAIVTMTKTFDRTMDRGTVY